MILFLAILCPSQLTEQNVCTNKQSKEKNEIPYIRHGVLSFSSMADDHEEFILFMLDLSVHEKTRAGGGDVHEIAKNVLNVEPGSYLRILL